MSKDKIKKHLPTAAVLIVGIAGIALMVLSGGNTSGYASGQLDQFATCLKERGAVFYGAFWCQHCQNEKAFFGSSANLLPYVECSAPDGQTQLSVCTAKKVEGYPTWDFKDGTRLTGEVTLKTLAEKTGCELPAKAK